ncbi:PepSY-associated TM helix domain-containing protein [Corallococcus carmarthensis]|uniref:PepSY domain-containing protein n=1 Tax=Corallococcus carmarthensis TaxID=2316728 RepID=A0A3A8JYL0_9BACT|nr:PepSY-associated TM helix domain-containing protein [Corallococcus carmarthensis]NOK19962.1 PepSY domain-containing protein [Corallococcus carmarthensis]RKG97304.1 PepSY domain-containing protein [Corallococcus carmarthensis]
MNPKLRSVLFWIHLVCGLIVGLVVGVMSFTGAAIAFESQIVDWADRDARHAALPAQGTPRLTLEEMLAKVKEAKPAVPPSGVTVYPEADSMVSVALGRGTAVYVHPFTGEVREQGAQGWRKFFHTMEELHRWLAASGDNRAVGKAITGVSNLAFLFLGITGLFLWWPRKWKLRAMRPTLWFRRGLKGKARDFNWHNVIGFWSLPVLVVLTVSGAVISYKWASNLAFTITGNEPPPAQGPIAAAPVPVPTPAPGTKPQPLDAQFATVMSQSQAWETITLRLATPPGAGGNQGGRGEGAPRGEGGRGDGAPRGEGGRGEGAPRGEGGRGEGAPRGEGGRGEGAPREGGPRAEGAPRGEGSPKAEGFVRGEGDRGQGRGGPGGAGKGGPQASAFTVREVERWPLFATVAVSVDPFTAQPLKTEAYADFNSGRKLRTWLRFLHTGEAFGWFGQLIAALASFGAVFLVYTGYALSWRRFVPRRRTQPAATAAPAAPPTESETHAA